MAAETLFVSFRAVDVCNAAFRAKANNITEASSTAERASASHAIDVTVVVIARFSANVENEKQTHFRERDRHYRIATHPGKTPTGAMMGRCHSVVRTGKTPTGDEIGDCPTARSGKTGTGSDRRIVLSSIFSYLSLSKPFSSASAPMLEAIVAVGVAIIIALDMAHIAATRRVGVGSTTGVAGATRVAV